MSTTRFYELRKLMEKAFNERKIGNAEKLANEYLEIADSEKENWNYGNAIHHGNLLLGRIALQNGKIEKAKEYLIKAGKTPGSPQLNTFGPNMKLANELLEIGEKEIVIKYIKLCEEFWDKRFSKANIVLWEESIERNETPDFKANLLY